MGQRADALSDEDELEGRDFCGHFDVCFCLL